MAKESPSVAFASLLAHVPSVLAAFLKVHRDAIIARAGTRVDSRASPRRTNLEMTDGVPVFLEQAGDALRLSKSSAIVDHEQIDRSAARHGRELHRMGLTVAQVVQEYGDVCQVVTELAIEHAAPISLKDFGTLSLCLDDAIASAVTAYSHASERAIADQDSERMSGLAHGLRGLLTTGPLASESESMKT